MSEYLKWGAIMYHVIVDYRGCRDSYKPIYEGYFDNPQDAEKVAIAICIEGGFAPWTVDIDCYKCNNK